MNRPVRTRTPGGVEGGAGCAGPPIPILHAGVRECLEQAIALPQPGLTRRSHRRHDFVIPRRYLPIVSEKQIRPPRKQEEIL
jgi:hypothetical protein